MCVADREGRITRVQAARGSWMCWDPVGRHLAYDGGTGDVGVLDIGDGSTRSIGDGSNVPFRGVPVWSPTGDVLAWSAGSGMIVADAHGGWVRHLSR